MNVGVPGEGDLDRLLGHRRRDGRAARRDARLLPPARLALATGPDRPRSSPRLGRRARSARSRRARLTGGLERSGAIRSRVVEASSRVAGGSGDVDTTTRPPRATRSGSRRAPTTRPRSRTTSPASPTPPADRRLVRAPRRRCSADGIAVLWSTEVLGDQRRAGSPLERRSGSDGRAERCGRARCGYRCGEPAEAKARTGRIAVMIASTIERSGPYRPGPIGSVPMERRRRRLPASVADR